MSKAKFDPASEISVSCRLSLLLSTSGLDGLRDVPESLFAVIVVEVVKKGNNFFILLEGILAEKS